MTGARHHHRALCAGVIAFGMALAAAPLGAQARSIPAVGERVRIVAPSVARKAVTGDLVAVRGDTLFVRGELAVTAVGVPLSQVERLRVRRPRSRMAGWGRGLLIGMPVGLAGGYVLGAISEGGGGRCGDDCGFLTAIGAAAGLVTGTVFGTIIGVGAPGSHWVEGHRPAPAVALSARPVAGRPDRSLSLAVSIPTP